VRSAPGLALAALAPRLPADTLLAAAARDALANWDGELTAESVPGAIYATLRYHLLRAAYRELEALRLMPTGLGAFATLPANMYLDRALPDLLRRLAAGDDAWLGDGRTWGGVLSEAWRKSLDELRGRLGDDMAQWRYGRIHTLTLRHPLGSVPALARIFNRGPWPMGGDLDTVCMGHAARDTAAGPTYVAPSYRQICDPGDWDRSRSIHPTGQSGHPGSRHYNDMARPWREVGYHPMLWSREKIEAATVATLNLEPAQ
jgi:penicillin amidase